MSKRRIRQEFELQSIRITAGPRKGSNEAEVEAEEKMPGFEAIWSVYDDRYDEYMVLCARPK